MSKKAHILVIEDSEEDFAMIERGLIESGVARDIKHFSHPAQVRAWIDAKNEPVDFIIVDLNLPGEKGTELIKALKSHAQHQSTPVAVLSTSANRRDIVESYAAGANAYHVKPLETPSFHELVKRMAGYWFRDVRMLAHLV